LTAAGQAPVAFLTGVTGGWGRAVLDRFLAGGWRVAATHLAGEDTSRLPQEVLPLEADLADPASAEQAVARCRAELGPPRALAHVAGGFAMGGQIEEAPLDVWRGQLDVNLETAHAVTRAVLPSMYELGGGAIVYVSSAAAVRPFAGAAAYVVSKAALLALMQAVDAEGRERGVRANAILPRIVDTPRNRAENPDADYSRWTTGAELAEVIHWLCSDASSPVSGAAIPAYGRA
jgi:NAD(P)-dependent dehydrogenase (short-subunit alcohol dehydrogenase family)